MPQIVIKEYDKTTAGSSLSNDFSVVVPGYLAADKSTDIFDENGIYECSTTADFISKIGKVEQSAACEGIGPTLTEIDAEAITEDGKTYAVLSATDFFNYLSQKIVYTRTEITAPVSGKEGYLVKCFNMGTENEKWYKYELATEDDWKDATYSAAVPFVQETAYSVGTYVTKYVQDKGNRLFICIAEYTGIESSFDTCFEATPKFSVIAAGKEGTDYNTGAKQFGNQIAYLLLTLGYKVFYLLINDSDRLITNADIWEPLKDRSNYDFRYLIGGLIDDADTITVNAVNAVLNGVASDVNAGTGRGDCFALLDIAKTVYKNKTSSDAVIAIKGNLPSADKYAAIFAPTVIYNNITDEVYTNSELPASFHYLACAAYAFDRYPEWYAVSGYQRGVSSMSLAGATVKFGEGAINALQPRKTGTGVDKAVNLIVKLGDAYYLWGNRTGYALSDELVASHFLNIRQLCCTIKKAVYTTCRRLTFDPNSDILWLNFCNAIRPTLEKMKSNQGIKDYRFERKETSKKGKLFAAIRIIPIEAVEDFEIGITLEDNFDETSIVLEETL